jgi:hypothetical protein
MIRSYKTTSENTLTSGPLRRLSNILSNGRVNDSRLPLRWFFNLPLLSHLEENLELFTCNLRPKQKKELSDHLLNGSGQFLHTLSELGLARAFHESGWQIDLAVKIGNRHSKDVDIRIKKDIKEALIEVVNLQANELHINPSLPFFPLTPPNVLDDKLINNVVGKYKCKFQEAIQNGWSGPAYLAVDVSKNEPLYVSLRLREERLGEDWQAQCAVEVVKRCPGLHGVIYYFYSADKPAAHSISWKRTPRQHETL